MKHTIFVSTHSLEMAGVKTEQTIHNCNRHYGRVVEAGLFKDMNLRQREIGGEWLADVPDDEKELAKFPTYVGRRTNGEPVI